MIWYTSSFSLWSRALTFKKNDAPYFLPTIIVRHSHITLFLQLLFDGIDEYVCFC